MAKKTEAVKEKKGKKTLTFGEVVSGVEIPKKQTNKGPFYNALLGLAVGDMLPVGGATRANARTNIKRVKDDNGGRDYEIRETADEKGNTTGVNIWRTA